MVARQGWEGTGEDLEAQIFLVAQAGAATLNHPNFVVESFDKSEGHLVLGLAVRRDAVPVPLDKCGRFLKRSEALSPQRLTPLLEEFPRPDLAPIFPQLRKLLLEHVRRVEALVRRQERLQRALNRP